VSVLAVAAYFALPRMKSLAQGRELMPQGSFEQIKNKKPLGWHLMAMPKPLSADTRRRSSSFSM
jgi:hypothetical protein